MCFLSVWLDGRTKETVDKLVQKTESKSKDEFQVCYKTIYIISETKCKRTLEACFLYKFNAIFFFL